MSASDPSSKRAIQTALAAGLADGHAAASTSARVSAGLLLCVHLTQTVLAGLFCWVCLRVYRGQADGLPGSWPACLAVLALAWVVALPAFVWLFRSAVPLERRLIWWSRYWLGLLGPLLVVVVLLVGVMRLRGRQRGGEGTARWRALLIGLLTTWPAMQVAAYLACSRALPMTVIEDSAMPPFLSAACVYGICLVLPLAFVAVALRVRRARLIHAASASDLNARTALVPGEAVVRGQVELAEGEERAVRLEVDQYGTESESSGTWSHTWTETKRRLTVRPFYLRAPGGERVRVLAGADPQLMDALEGKILVNRTLRTCVAELTPKETVTAFGELVRARDPEAEPAGYRSGSVGWVLQPPQGARMLLSSYPIDRPFLESASRILLHVVPVLALVGAGQCALLGYHLRVFSGETVEASVAQARRVERESDDGTEIEHHVTAALPGGRNLTREVSAQSFGNAKLGGSIAVLRDPLLGSVQFGERPTASFWAVVLAALTVLLLLLLGSSDRPDPKWYSKPKLNDWKSGRLPEAPSTVPNSTSDIRALVDEALGRKS